MAKVEIVAERCKSCGYCVKFCPKQVLEIGTGVNSKGYEYVDAMRRGACAFIQKTADRARLLQAIVDAMAKSRGAVGDSTPGALVAAWNTLTDREKEVAKLVAEGLLNREVGERLGGIAVKTVQVHRSEACSKLGVKGAAGLAQAVRAVEMALKVRQTP